MAVLIGIAYAGGWIALIVAVATICIAFGRYW